MGVVSRASLHPPAHGGGDDLPKGRRPSWILLDSTAYVANRRNSTTATCKFKGDNELQVTFFPAHPPHLSYFCVHCSGLKSDAYAIEPQIIATEANLALLRIAFGRGQDMLRHSAHQYFIYRADGGGPNGRPLLEQLPHPTFYVFHDEQVGLLSYDTGYTIVALRDDSTACYRKDNPPGPGHYDVCTLHSKNKVWTIQPVNAPPQELQKQSSSHNFRHETSKVITIGGQCGTMAFVDLWRGILYYDVFGDSPLLRYTPLPEICPSMRDYSVNPLHTRDIALVNGRFKYMEKVKAKMSTGFDGWKAVTWSMPASSTSNLEDWWLPPLGLEACDILDDKNLVCSELLPKLNYYDEGEIQPTLASLNTGPPMLSLDEDEIVYFMTKVNLIDTKACMVALDMKSRKLQGLVEFAAERTGDRPFTCTQSRISSYLKIDTGMRLRTKVKGKKVLMYGLTARP